MDRFTSFAFGPRGLGLLGLAAGLWLAGCDDGDHPPTTPRPGADAGTGGGDGGTATEPTGPTAGPTEPTGPAAPPDSPLDQGIDEALAQGPAPVPAREIVPLSSAEAAEFERGVLAFEATGDDAAARTAFESVLASNDTAYRAAYNLGYLAERRGDNREAILEYQRALDIKPEYPTALRALFRLLARSGRASEGVEQVRARAQAYPQNPEMQQVLAEAYIESGRADDGILVARQLLLVDSQNLQAFLILLKAAIQQEREALVSELLTRITEQLQNSVPFESCSDGGAPENRTQCKLWAFCKFTLASQAQAKGRKFEAKQYFADAVSADPTFVEARVQLAGFQLDVGQVDAALENLEAAHRLAPTWLPVLVGLGNAYRGKGDFARSAEALREAQRLYPTSPEAFIGLGLTMYDARVAGFEGMDRAQLDTAAMDAFRRAQSLMGTGDDTEVAALLRAAQDDYDFATAPPPAPIEDLGGGEPPPGGDGWGGGDDWGGGGGTEGGGTEGGGTPGGGTEGGGTQGGGTEGGGTQGGGTEGGGGAWGGGGW